MNKTNFWKQKPRPGVSNQESNHRHHHDHFSFVTLEFVSPCILHLFGALINNCSRVSRLFLGGDGSRSGWVVANQIGGKVFDWVGRTFLDQFRHAWTQIDFKKQQETNGKFV